MSRRRLLTRLFTGIVLAEFSEWSALRSEFESKTVAQERGITQAAVDAVRAALANVAPAQIEYGALKGVFVGLPEVYAGQKTVAQLLQETAQARARVATPAALAVSTPEPPATDAKTTIVFVPNRDRMGTFEEPTLYKALVDEFHRQNPDIQVQVRTFTGFMSDEDIARQSDVFLGRRRVPFEEPQENQ